METAVRRAILTGLNQAAAKSQEALADELDCDLVEVTAHSGARVGKGIANHAAWQGKIYSRSGKSTKYPSLAEKTGYGSGAGLCGWNCRHSFYPYIEGSERAYTDDELQALNEPKYEYNGERLSEYEATQKQRYIERQIRKYKREVAGFESAGVDTTDSKSKLRRWQDRQRDFIEQTGLKRDYGREQIGMLHKTVAKSKNSGIIKTGSEKVALENQRYGRNKNTLINKSYIDGGEYRRKFDNATENPLVNKSLYDNSKKALKHRSGTAYEDMYWIDLDTLQVVAQEVNTDTVKSVVYSNRTMEIVQKYKNLMLDLYGTDKYFKQKAIVIYARSC